MEIVDQIVTLRAVVVETFGAGEAGITALQEIAEDNNFSVRIYPDRVVIDGLSESELHDRSYGGDDYQST